MKLYVRVLKTDPRTKKNHMMIAGTGSRCPYCGKPKRQFIRQGHVHDRYEAEASLFLAPKPKEPMTGPLSIKYHFYMKTHRKVDASNLIAAADDLLVKEGVIADDNASVLVHHDGTRVFYDKENPRTEIYIYQYEEDEDVEKPQGVPN